MAATPVRARLLLLESPLQSLAPLAGDQRRLEFGSAYFGAHTWAGYRHQLRYAGSRGDALSWSLTLPWLYSSYANGGRGGRDNLLLGAGLRLAGGEGVRLRLGGELWLPFADAALAPLGERRAFGRATLLLASSSGSRPGFQAAFSYRGELVGLGPETEDAAWPERMDLESRLARQPAVGAGFFLAGGAAVQASEDLQAAWLGGGLGVNWGDTYCMELGGEAWFGAQDEPGRPDYRVHFRLRRDLSLATTATPAEGDPGAGGIPPLGSP